ncbi:unnamed protein product [Diatraea saccharalis]|uniref:PHD-type domain-containing protein n=1 Tax=Diatraea saccharalis TaxID=40085 RepID=A0A9N9R674_9NEOP|nr:unnamed protein product [Diatraea saccharalis]
MTKSGWGCCIPKNTNGNEDFIVCTKCKKKFHNACIALDSSFFTAEMRVVWSCPECVSNTPRFMKKDSTPIQEVSAGRNSKIQALSSPPVDKTKVSMSTDAIQNILDVMTKNINENFSQIRSDMSKTINEELKLVKSELSQIKESMCFIGKQYDELKKIHEANQSLITELRKENNELKSTVEDLGHRLSQVEQQSRQSNIELQCVPEHKNGNLFQIINDLGKVVGCSITSNDILNCTRTAKIYRSSTRPRSIVVQLASPKLRDKLLASTIKFNK